MIRFSHMRFPGSSHGIEMLVLLVVLVMTIPGWAKAAEGNFVGGADSANPPAITIDDAQILRIQDVVVGSPVSGIVASVAVREGQSISKGTQLAELDSERSRKELAAAKAEFEAALIESQNDVNTRYAERTLEVRQRELKQSREANQRYSGSVTATEMDRLKLVVDQAALSVEQARQEIDVAMATVNFKAAAVDLARLRVQEHTIESTISGRVAEVAVQPGQWVEAGAPIARIVSLDPIRVSAFVDGRRFDRSLVGRSVEFQWNADENERPLTLKGAVTFVSDELNPITSQVRLWADLSNPDEIIRPGMRGKLILLPSQPTPETDDALELDE